MWVRERSPISRVLPFTTNKRCNYGDCIDSKVKMLTLPTNLNRPTGFSTNTYIIVIGAVTYVSGISCYVPESEISSRIELAVLV